ncbi:MAG TPA: sigma-70 family RNA polymerase sigma factor [Vicinamibacterales bacterium]|nr:sigma-70 family RNA polymerase sigma factor [Vicinamibacterales bacterium]
MSNWKPVDASAVARLWRGAGADRWDLPKQAFADALEASVAKAFAGRGPTTREVERYLSSLHAADLALACACALGHEGAWEHFVREHRPVLYRAADALVPGGGARELADSLYADLYGLRDTDGRRHSLFRYFHGRSSLGTWLRAVLAQRHVDLVRSRRRTESLPEDEDAVVAPPSPSCDPDDRRLRGLAETALKAAIERLASRDRLRLRSYHAVGLTLARIGRLIGEHEATVSRHLARTRRGLRAEVERTLTAGGLAEAQVARAFELLLEDPAGLDVEVLLGGAATRKDDEVGRSRYEGDG